MKLKVAHNYPIKLNIFDRELASVVFPVCVFLLAIPALMNSQVVLTIVLLLLALNFKRIGGILRFSKVSPVSHVNRDQLTLIIFPDGRVRLESMLEDTIEGCLETRQWCTRHAAVIRIISGRETYRLVALSIQQEKPENFRRLNMWLRQNFYPDARGEPASGN